MSSLQIDNNIHIEQPFIKKMLSPYFEHTSYLKDVLLPNNTDSKITFNQAIGEFSIDDSCYINNTGHFNAVEFNICYNQLAYAHMGYCIKNKLIKEVAAYDLDSFLQNQLSHFLITKISSSYRTQINAKHFFGSYEINNISTRSKYVFMETTCKFYDEQKGKSTGQVNTVIILP